MKTTIQPVRARLLIGWIALGALVNGLHWSPVFLVAVPLAAAAMLAPLARHPLPWLAAAALWAPLGVLGWDRLEDHVYFGIYLILAVGIALTRDDVRDSMRLQFRLVTGALFAVAVMWKVTSMAFWRGDVFHTVLVYDGRFDVLSRWLGGLSQSAIAANRAAFEAMEQSTATLSSVPVEGGTQMTLLLLGLVVWTLLIEAAVAVSFLAPDHHPLARLRHPSLLAFGLSTYPLVPVLGFAIMFTAVGLALSDDVRVQSLYLAMTFAAFGSFALRAVF